MSIVRRPPASRDFPGASAPFQETNGHGAELDTSVPITMEPRESDPARPKRGSELWLQLESQLRSLAHRIYGPQKNGVTLQPSDVVQEAYLRYLKSGDRYFTDPARFYAFIGKVMSSVLVDHARKKKTATHSPPGRRLPVESLLEAFEAQAQGGLLELECALEELERMDPDGADLVFQHFFAGLPMEKIAEMRGTSLSTVRREWRVLRGWLRQRMP